MEGPKQKITNEYRIGIQMGLQTGWTMSQPELQQIASRALVFHVKLRKLSHDAVLHGTRPGWAFTEC